MEKLNLGNKWTRFEGDFTPEAAKRHGSEMYRRTRIHSIVVFMLTTIIVSLIAYLGELSAFLPLLLAVFITPAIFYGAYKTYRTLQTTGKLELRTLMDGFRDGWFNIIAANLIVSVKVILWSLLFIIPGIVCAYRYFFVNYILVDNPEMPYDEVLKLSAKLTNGRKLDLFGYALSWILWILAIVFTFGLAILYVGPYMEHSGLAIYDAAIKDYNNSEIVA